jgi:hypothetical protein
MNPGEKELYAWMCRVRRDILVIEKYLQQVVPGDYKTWRVGIGQDPTQNNMGPHQSAANANAASKKILWELGYPDLQSQYPPDPGDPPEGPYE